MIVLVLARGTAEAASLVAYPESPFIRVKRPDEGTPLSSAWVIGEPGLRGRIAADFIRPERDLLTVAWDLHPNDPAVHDAAYIIDEPSPQSLLRVLRPYLPPPHPLLHPRIVVGRPSAYHYITDDDDDRRPERRTRPYAPVLPTDVPSAKRASLDRRRSRDDEDGHFRVPPGAGTILKAPGLPGAHTTLFALVRDMASKYGLDPALALAVAHEESRFRADALSKRGAMGVMQIMPATAADFKVRDPWNPIVNVTIGVLLLKRYMGRYPVVEDALSAYRSGRFGHDMRGVSIGDTNYALRVAVWRRNYQRILADAVISEGP